MVLRRMACRAFSERGRPGGRLSPFASGSAFCREDAISSQLSVVVSQLSGEFSYPCETADNRFSCLIQFEVSPPGIDDIFQLAP